MYAKVVLQLPLPPLLYKIPNNNTADLSIGSAVYVPLRGKSQLGFITEIIPNITNKPEYNVKNISHAADGIPPLPVVLLNFFSWISDYYHYPLGEIISSTLPKKLENPSALAYELLCNFEAITEVEKKKLCSRGGRKWELLEFCKKTGPIHLSNSLSAQDKTTLKKLVALGYLKEIRIEKDLDFFGNKKASTNASYALTEEQAQALSVIRKSIEKKSFETFLLEGVTGSGKTEVYLGAAQACIANGRSVVIMVPEIALTPQLFDRVNKRLGNEIAIIHSGLTEKERSHQWHLVRRGKVKIVLGARSTIFSPIDNIGLLIVDEEHDGAFKQEDRLRYNARDLAIVRAMQSNATVLLGSATPSLESYYNVRSGKYKHLELKNRVTGSALPEVTVVDLKKEKPNGSFSSRLLEEIQNTLNQNKQVMLFLNRRGYSPYVLCASCGDVPQCPNCSVSLTYYQKSRSLLCHYCDFSVPMVSSCQKCNEKNILPGGIGTENVEEQVKSLFPTARVLRIDRESTQKRNSLENALLKIANKDVDIIVGTQMIAKGHDFPDIHLVAILNADSTINIPDFRSAERSFQLFTQMAGRAGRSIFNGTVILQTYNPEHSSILHSAKHNFKAFAEEELSLRKNFHYPPFCRIVRIVVNSMNNASAKMAIDAIANDLNLYKDMQTQPLEILGPAPSVIAKIQNKYRWNLLIKSPQATTLQRIIKNRLPDWKKRLPKSCVVQVDVDPLSLL